tara:strand:- start:2921 stop:3544 length:624 start_codon:yes stop_codon:yes gene_type:complete
MAVRSPVLTDNSTLSKIDQSLYRVESWFALLSGIAVFSLMILAVVSVSGRHLFNQPLPGYVDWIEQAMPLIAFMGVAYTQRDGGHIRMDILVSRLKGRALWAVEFITVLMMLAVMLILVWGSWAHFQRSFDFNSPMWSRDSSMDIALPLWPSKLLAPVAFGVLCLRLVLQLVAFGHAFITNATSPPAVPLIEDVVTQAAKEADTVSG